MFSAPCDLHQQVSIASLLYRGGLVDSVKAGQHAIAKGNVYIERWNIGVAESTLPRWVLRGVTITVAGRSIAISEDGTRVRPVREVEPLA